MSSPQVGQSTLPTVVSGCLCRSCLGDVGTPPIGAIKCSISASSRLCNGGADGRSGMVGDLGGRGELGGVTYGAQEGKRSEESPADRARERSGCVGRP